MSMHVTAEQIQNLDPYQRNQLLLDFAMRVHSKCMHHCLDEDKREYRIHEGIRELMVLECNRAALDVRRYEAKARRFDVVLPEWRRRELKRDEIRARIEARKINSKKA